MVLPLLLSLACADAEDPAPRRDPDTPGDTDTDAPLVDDFVGFVATGEVHGRKSDQPWCDVALAIQGTRDDTLCPECDFAFALDGEAEVVSGDTGCEPPDYATWAEDAHHLDPVLGYVADYLYDYGYYEYVWGDVWFVDYTDAFTQMDVYGQVDWVTGDRHRRFLRKLTYGEAYRLEADAAGFTWTERGLDWWHEASPTLWTACADTAESWYGEEGILGAYVVESVREGEVDADRWTFPVEAGAVVHVAVDDEHENFPGAQIYVVRPDGCLGRIGRPWYICSGATTENCPSVDFVADVGGEWAVVVTVLGYWGGGHVYRLGIQVDGVDVVPVQTDEDVDPYVDGSDSLVYTGSAEIAGTWVR